MLETIEGYEKRTKKHFNKGIVYGNLGVSIASRGDIDHGFAYLLKAHEEDSPFLTQGFEPAFLLSPLFTQFERKVVKYIEENSNGYQSVKVMEQDVMNLLSSLDVDSRLFLIGAVWSIARNLYLTDLIDNCFTRGRLLVNIKDICLFVERARALFLYGFRGFQLWIQRTCSIV